MDVALKTLLETASDGIDIWVATNGIIVSGHTVGLVNFFDRYLTLTGRAEGTFRKMIDEKMAAALDEPERKADEDQASPVVLFSNATIYANGRILCSGPMSLNADLIAAWGPGLMVPAPDPTDYIPH